MRKWGLIFLAFFVVLPLIVLAGRDEFSGLSERQTAILKDPSKVNKIIFLVNGEPVSEAEYLVVLEEVRNNLRMMQEMENEQVRVKLAIMKKYSPELIAFAGLLSDKVLFLAAENEGIEAPQTEVEEMVRKTEEMYRSGRLPSLQTIVQGYGESEYFGQYLPKVYREQLTKGLYLATKSGGASPGEEARITWELTKKAIAQSRVRIVDPRPEFDVQKALAYLKEFWAQ